MRLSSDAFEDEGAFPVKYAKDGENISPPLGWTELPEGTRELALVFENVTPETREPFVQWLLYKIPAETSGLREGFKHKADPEDPDEVLQGRNSLGNVGYDGPLGVAGRAQRYRFRLFALDRPLDIPEGLERDGLFQAMSDYVIGESTMGVQYERPR